MLKDKVVIISGASRGIGKAIAWELSRAGCHLSFSYRTNESEAKKLEAEILRLGRKARAFRVDIKDYDAVKAWVDQTREFFLGIDIVVNNAGIIKDKALMLMEKDDWNEVISTNLTGTYNLCRAAIIGLMKQKSGIIINISSVSGITGLPRQTNYSASKAGMLGFTKALAKEVAPFNIRVNAIAAGFIETDMTKGLKEDLKNKMLAQIPLSRFGTPEEVAKAVKFLAEEESAYITGQTIVIDGGLSM